MEKSRLKMLFYIIFFIFSITSAEDQSASSDSDSNSDSEKNTNLPPIPISELSANARNLLSQSRKSMPLNTNIPKSKLAASAADVLSQSRKPMPPLLSQNSVLRRLEEAAKNLTDNSKTEQTLDNISRNLGSIANMLTSLVARMQAAKPIDQVQGKGTTKDAKSQKRPEKNEMNANMNVNANMNINDDKVERRSGQNKPQEKREEGRRKTTTAAPLRKPKN